MGDDLVKRNQAEHKLVSDLFFKFNLSYKFTSAILGKDTEVPEFRFVFSKTRNDKPVPDVVVEARVRPVKPQDGQDDGKKRYTILFEGQKYERTLTVDPENVAGDELNEALINKIHEQKIAVRRMGLP
eukprot:TRINITY_DN3932_c0_g2_i1.p2 TRINITY_DN3932_c0_g2~~TRINITY_DN3932_c0_g2_i1.p2  ORF type:complete len:128 (+),score=47.31 TRINITY_DN3932_c0_g2_i1:67-450(+)